LSRRWQSQRRAKPARSLTLTLDKVEVGGAMRTAHVSVLIAVALHTQLVGAAIAQISVRPGNIDGLPDAMVVRVDRRTEPVPGFQGKLHISVMLQGNREYLERRPAAVLKAADSSGVLVWVGVAGTRLDDKIQYSFDCDESMMAHSKLSFTGASGRAYEMQLIYWDNSRTLFRSEFRLEKPRVVAGDTSTIEIYIRSDADIELHFGSSNCKFQYDVRDTTGEIVARSPYLPCDCSLSGLMFAAGESKVFAVPLYTKWKNWLTGATESIAPGRYVVDCEVVGYRDLGLSSNFELVVE